MSSFFSAAEILLFGLVCIGCAFDRQDQAANNAVPLPVAVQSEKTQKNEDPCETICRRSLELNCSVPQNACREACSDMIDTPICRAEMEAVMQCVIREPAKHWECSEQQIAAIKDGFCQREQLEFMRCYAASTEQ